MKGVPAKRAVRDMVVEDQEGEDGVAFNVSSILDSSSLVDASSALLLGIYGANGMVLFERGSMPYMAGAVATMLGGAAYYNIYFNT